MSANSGLRPRALILVGGYGTRLRPLTLSKPKPLVEFVGKPLLLHQLEALQEAGVEEVVLALSYMPQGFREFLDSFESKLCMRIHCSQECEPLGTAGPLGLARDILLGSHVDSDSAPPFFVLNSDVVCEFKFNDLLQHHLSTKAKATIMATQVEDPSRFGVMLQDDLGRVTSFVEKPKTYIGNTVNAGIYVLDPSVLDMIEPRAMSIEKDVFPRIADRRELSCWINPGYWADVGQPGDYLHGTTLHLDYLRSRQALHLGSGENVRGNVVIDPSAFVSPNCSIGPNTVIGANCVVEDGARVHDSVLMEGCTVQRGALVSKSIIGWKSKIGRWARVENFCVLGCDVTIKEEVHVTGCKILPHKEIKESILTPKIVL